MDPTQSCYRLIKTEVLIESCTDSCCFALYLLRSVLLRLLPQGCCEDTRERGKWDRQGKGVGSDGTDQVLGGGQDWWWVPSASVIGIMAHTKKGDDHRPMR